MIIHIFLFLNSEGEHDVIFIVLAVILNYIEDFPAFYRLMRRVICFDVGLMLW